MSIEMLNNPTVSAGISPQFGTLGCAQFILNNIDMTESMQDVPVIKNKTNQISYSQDLEITTMTGILRSTGNIIAYCNTNPIDLGSEIPALQAADASLASDIAVLSSDVSLLNQISPQALANKLLVQPVGTVTPTGLTWSLGNAANSYVPLLSNASVLTVAPINPSTTGTGWRFSKTYTLNTVANGLTVGNRYTIVAVGTINWTSIGATAATIGTQFTYNGVAITGTGGTATENQKISWYPLNALYGLSLPQSMVPSIAVRKKNLRNAWVLIKMNADCALQGSLAIQIETYAYQYGGNTTNDYTGRWAYSFPQTFNAAVSTNITTSLTTPRLRSGFIYLLYAGDISPSLQPSAGFTYATNGATLFAPSQVSTENTLRDPYDVYPQYPHLGLTSSSYVANGTAPSYGGSSPYSDPADVEVASIYLNTNSTSPTNGVGQTVLDFNVLAFGYSGVGDAGNSVKFAYECNYV